MPLRVYYAPTQANRLVTQALAGNPKFKFIELHPAPEYRKQQLRDIEGPAAFIWGDGGRHEESYYFTKDQVSLKVNADQHVDDWIHGPRDLRNIGFWNHMHHTCEDGICTINPVDSKGAVSNAIAILRALSNSPRGSNPIGITIDGDGIHSFPARMCWVNPWGISVQALADLVEATGPNLVRLDMGGLVEEIPPFTLVRSAGVPSFGDARIFSNLDGEDPLRSSQYLIDHVASYAVLAYEKALRAYADVLGVI